MKLWRRLLYYGIGVGLGVLMVKFIFGDRDDIQCTYFPNDRVLYDIRNKDHQIPDEVMSEMKKANIDTSDISDLLLMGKVDFSKSKTKLDSCKTYWIEFEPDEKPEFFVEFENCDSTVTMVNFSKIN